MLLKTPLRFEPTRKLDAIVEKAMERRADHGEVLLAFDDGGGALREELIEAERLAYMRPAEPGKRIDHVRVTGHDDQGDAALRGVVGELYGRHARHDGV